MHLLDLSVEEAFKLIMSAAIAQPAEARQLMQEVGSESVDEDDSALF